MAAGIDVYEYSNGAVRLVSAGGNGPYHADGWWWYTSDDGSHTAFRTSERLDPADTDSEIDVYERAGGSTVLVSTGPSGGNGPFRSSLDRVSRDGSHIFFNTEEQLTAEDTDTEGDIYVRAEGTTRLISQGPAPGPPCVNSIPGLCDPHFLGAARDGSRAFFASHQSLVAEDIDDAQDIYVREGAATTLVSAHPSGGTGAYHGWEVSISDDGRTIYFQSDEQLTPSDTDSALDVYRARVPTGYPRPAGATPTYAYLVPAYQACIAPDRTHGPPLAYGSCSGPDQVSQHLTVGTPDANGKGAKSVGYARYGTAAATRPHPPTRPT